MRSIRNRMLSLFCAALLGHAAVIPPLFINSVVAIGHNEQTPGGPATWVTEASGFLYGYLVQDDPDPLKRGYDVYLITNRHVIQNHAVVFIRLNPKQQSDQGQVFNAPAINWFTHKDPTVDIAAARINWQLLLDRGIDVDFMASDTHSVDTKRMKDIGVSAGDGIFVLGFPMNLAGQQRNYVIVRPGAIARVSDLMESAVPVLLIDSHVFPGNSGGPVILAPSPYAINGTKKNNTAYLLGAVRSFIPYVDVAISPQTQHARVTFEENSGLAEVVPIDKINEAIKAWRDSLPPSPPAPLKAAPETH
jgi:hypothetical protein